MSYDIKIRWHHKHNRLTAGKIVRTVIADQWQYIVTYLYSIPLDTRIWMWPYHEVNLISPWITIYHHFDIFLIWIFEMHPRVKLKTQFKMRPENRTCFTVGNGIKWWLRFPIKNYTIWPPKINVFSITLHSTVQLIQYFLICNS